MTPISKIKRARFYMYKNKKIAKCFYTYPKNQKYFKKQDNLRYVFMHKKPDTLCYVIFHENFEIGIYIEIKSMILCVTWRFCIKKSGLFENSKTVCVKFLIYKNLDTLRYAIFHGIFETGGGGRVFVYEKKHPLCAKFYMQKKKHFPLPFYTQKSHTLCITFLYTKKQCTLRYVFISKIIRILYSDT